MKKLITLLSGITLFFSAAVAQNTKTYTGFVVDEVGNPVVGAEVMAPGGGVSTITDSDGSFTIEVPILLKKLTASYAGMGEKTVKLENASNIVFKMKNLKKMTGFVSVFANIGVDFEKWEEKGYSDSDTNFTYGAGIMGGQLGQISKWGWYIKGSTMLYGDDFNSYISGSLTAGAIRRLSQRSHLYFGAGAAYSGDVDAAGFALDLGGIFNVSDHVNIIAGLNYCYAGKSGESTNYINFNLGVGYTF